MGAEGLLRRRNTSGPGCIHCVLQKHNLHLRGVSYSTGDLVSGAVPTRPAGRGGAGSAEVYPGLREEEPVLGAPVAQGLGHLGSGSRRARRALVGKIFNSCFTHLLTVSQFVLSNITL